jgi:hypothetical protein
MSAIIDLNNVDHSQTAPLGPNEQSTVIRNLDGELDGETALNNLASNTLSLKNLSLKQLYK